MRNLPKSENKVSQWLPPLRVSVRSPTRIYEKVPPPLPPQRVTDCKVARYQCTKDTDKYPYGTRQQHSCRRVLLYYRQACAIHYLPTPRLVILKDSTLESHKIRHTTPIAHAVVAIAPIPAIKSMFSTIVCTIVLSLKIACFFSRIPNGWEQANPWRYEQTKKNPCNTLARVRGLLYCGYPTYEPTPMSERAGVSLPCNRCRLLADTAVRNLASKTPTEPQEEGCRTDTDGGGTDRAEVSRKVSKSTSNSSSHYCAFPFFPFLILR